jgi:hypothetical protein
MTPPTVSLKAPRKWPGMAASAASRHGSGVKPARGSASRVNRASRHPRYAAANPPPTTDVTRIAESARCGRFNSAMRRSEMCVPITMTAHTRARPSTAAATMVNRCGYGSICRLATDTGSPNTTKATPDRAIAAVTVSNRPPTTRRPAATRPAPGKTFPNSVHATTRLRPCPPSPTRSPSAGNGRSAYAPPGATMRTSPAGSPPTERTGPSTAGANPRTAGRAAAPSARSDSRDATAPRPLNPSGASGLPRTTTRTGRDFSHFDPPRQQCGREPPSDVDHPCHRPHPAHRADHFARQ